MRRAYSPEIAIAELKKRIALAKSHKEKIQNYLSRVEEKYSSGHLSYEEYHAAIRKEIHKKTPNSWIHYYNSYIHECERHLKHHNKKLLKKEILTISASLFFVLIFVSVFFLSPNFVGFITKDYSVQDFSDNVNLNFTQNTNYTLEIQNSEILKYVNVDGSFYGNGSFKIYLNEYLIYESSSSKSSEITGNSISDFGMTGKSIEENYSIEIEELNESFNLEINSSNLSNSEELNGTSQVNLSPSQEKSLSFENENNFESFNFNNVCEETCDLEEFNLNFSSYEIKIEISNGTLNLKSINYGVFFHEKENFTEPKEANIKNITLVQGEAVLGQPVVWKKNVELENFGEINISIPKNAENVVVKQSETQKEVNANIIEPIENKVVKSITGNFVEEQIEGESYLKVEIKEKDSLKYEIKYETPAPYSIEENLSNGKKIKIVGPDEIHYENVLAFTNLDENLNLKNPSKIKIFWVENLTYLEVKSVQDKDNNGIYDYVEWNIPHLSNQTFEIIVITKAEHLDTERNFFSDIYNEVYKLDNIWSEEISDNEYVRVTFEKNLTSINDITIFPRIVSGNPEIEVYEKDKDDLIVKFSDLISNDYNKVLLTNLEKEQNTFDLKIVDGSVQFDYIVDPVSNYNFSWYTTNVAYWASPAGSSRFTAGTQATSAQYVNMSSNDAQYAIVQTDDRNDEPFWRFNITLNETRTAITWINVSFKGYENASELAGFYIYNFTSSAWIYVGNIGSGTNTVSTVNYTDLVAQQIVNPNNNQVVVVVEGANFDLLDGDSVFVDSVILLVGSSDTVYPQFSNYTETPTNASNYSYEQIYSINSTIVNTNGTVWLEFNGVNYSATNLSVNNFGVYLTNGLSAGSYSYIWWAYGNGTNNNLNSSQSRDYYVNKTSLTATLTNDKTWTRDYDGTPNVLGISESNNGDGDVIYKIYRDGIDKGNSDSISSAGTYSLVLNSTGGTNYSSFPSLNSNTLIINPIQSSVNLTLNSSEFNATIESGTLINLNCSILNGDSNSYISLYNNGTLINNGTSPIGNYTLFDSEGLYNITCVYQPSQNYTSNSSIFWINVTASSNSLPQIINVFNESMTDVSSGPNEGPFSTSVIINFSVYDANGNANINDSSAKINFTKTGETTRENLTCTEYWSSGNYANYTCNVIMWWWDGAGLWNITAYISDINSNSGINDSQKFSVGTTAGFQVTPSSLTFSSISPGAINTESNKIILLNNTGNDEVSIEVNATNLYGEQNNAYALYAENFSVSTSSGCGGTAMVSQTYTSISGASLPIGNYTINDGTAQEQLYFCLKSANSNLISQSYSTSDAGAWIIRIFFVAISGTSRIRKKIKNKNKSLNDDKLLEALSLISEELKQEYSLNKKQLVEVILEKLSDKHNILKSEILKILKSSEKNNYEIPLGIFSRDLGALESVVKYLKENLKMSYKEISEKLNRDERTIWNVYANAIKKSKKVFSFDSNNLEKVPLSIFDNKNLTILESLIIYLKDKRNLKYTEISKLIDRDQRNVWTVYTRAKHKL